jgi:hypothetical protein
MSGNTTNKKAKGGGSGKRYQFKILFNSIKRIKPVCTAEWEDVAESYHRESKEQKLRDGAELKRTFFNHKKMCNKHKVPTGTSDDAPFVKECIKLANELGDKEHKGIAGGSDSEEEDEMEEKKKRTKRRKMTMKLMWLVLLVVQLNLWKHQSTELEEEQNGKLMPHPPALQRPRTANPVAQQDPVKVLAKELRQSSDLLAKVSVLLPTNPQSS